MFYSVSAEYATTGGNNLTLTCSLTCVEDCGDFNLSWIHSGQDGLKSGPIGHNTLISKLFLPDRQGTEKIACAVLREGVEMAVKEWTIQRGKTFESSLEQCIAMICVEAVFCHYCDVVIRY